MRSFEMQPFEMQPFEMQIEDAARRKWCKLKILVLVNPIFSMTGDWILPNFTVPQLRKITRGSTVVYILKSIFSGFGRHFCIIFFTEKTGFSAIFSIWWRSDLENALIQKVFIKIRKIFLKNTIKISRRYRNCNLTRLISVTFNISWHWFCKWLRYRNTS